VIGAATAPAAPMSTWDTIKDDAGYFEDYYDAPVVDAAAVIGVEAAWLGGILLAIKFVATGLWYEFEKKDPRPR
jgi:predicted outer membrane lipoprotein